MAETLLRIDGLVDNAAEFSFADLKSLAEPVDVSTVDARRDGAAIRLADVLQAVSPGSDATHLTLHGSADGFSAEVPLEAAAEVGLLIYAIDDAPLTPAAGGPIRFWIPNAAECETAELDACANVKFLDRIEVTGGSA